MAKTKTANFEARHVGVARIGPLLGLSIAWGRTLTARPDFPAAAIKVNVDGRTYLYWLATDVTAWWEKTGKVDDGRKRRPKGFAGSMAKGPEVRTPRRKPEPEAKASKPVKAKPELKVKVKVDDQKRAMISKAAAAQAVVYTKPEPKPKKRQTWAERKEAKARKAAAAAAAMNGGTV